MIAVHHRFLIWPRSLLGILAALATRGEASRAQTAPRDLHVAGIEVRLFRADSGVWSPDVLAARRPDLLNVAIGNAPWGPSLQLTVRVEVTGPIDHDVRGTVRLRSTIVGNITNQELAVPGLEASARWFGIFLVPINGCSPVTLDLTLVSASGGILQTEHRLIPFQCGE